MDEITDGGGGLSFEDFKNQNGMTFWWASEVCLMLGYRDLKSFEPVLRRTERALLSLGADIHDNIRAHERGDGGSPSRDYKMTRFACYLASMNGDPSKREVAAMQAYFAVQTRLLESQCGERGQVGRAEFAANLFRIALTEEHIKSKLAHAGKSSWPALAGCGQSRTFAQPIGKRC